MELYLIRHGKTAGNLEKRYVGRAEESVLPEALEAIRHRKAPAVSSVYVSPKIRCIETAEALFPDRKLTIKEGLQECDFGEFEYCNYQELKENKKYQEWMENGGLTGFPGGETLAVFQGRCVKSFLEIIGEAEEKRDTGIALVVHGGTIMALLDAFSCPHQDYFCWQIENASGYRGILSKQAENRFGYVVKEIERYE